AFQFSSEFPADCRMHRHQQLQSLYIEVPQHKQALERYQQLRHELPDPDQFERLVLLQQETRTGSGDTAAHLVVRRLPDAVAVDFLDYVKATERSLDERNSSGATPLLLCCGLGKPLSAGYLLRSGLCDVNASNCIGIQPLLQACALGQLTLAGRLLDCGADPTAADITGSNAFHQLMEQPELEARLEDVLAMMARLQLLGLRLSDENSIGFNPLFVGVQRDRLDFLRALLAAPEFGDAVVEECLQNSHGMTLAHVAAGHSCLASLELLLTERFGPERWSRLLLSRVTGGICAGFTCLHFAVQARLTKNIAHLVRHGLRLSARSDSGLTCVDLAIENDGLESLLAACENSAELEVVHSLIDPVWSSCALPSCEEAEQIMYSHCSLHLRRRIAAIRGRDTVGVANRFAYGDLLVDDGDFHPAIQLLYAAIRDNSVRLLLSISALRLWDGLVFSPSSVDQQFRAYIVHLGQERRLDESLLKAIVAGPSCEDRVADLAMEALSDRYSLWCMNNVAVAALKWRRFAVAKELLVMRQFDLVPTCLLVLIECRLLSSSGLSRWPACLFDEGGSGGDGGGSDLLPCRRGRVSVDLRLFESHRFATRLLLNSVRQLYKNCRETQRSDVFKFLRGSFGLASAAAAGTRGPLFNCTDPVKSKPAERSVFELMQLSGCQQVFSTKCLNDFVDRAWLGSGAMPPRPKGRRAATLPLIGRYFLDFLSYALFMVMYCRLAVFGPLPNTKWLEVTLLMAFSAGFLCQEMPEVWDAMRRNQKFSHQFCAKFYSRRCNCKCCVGGDDCCGTCGVGAYRKLTTGLLLMPINFIFLLYVLARSLLTYFRTDRWNAIDLIVILIPGVTACIMLSTDNSSEQLYFFTGFAIVALGLRLLSYLRPFHWIGPTVSMMRSLFLRDLPPFLCINCIIIGLFGLLVVNLLCPRPNRDWYLLMRQVAVRGFFLTFGQLEMDLPGEQTKLMDELDTFLGSNGTVASEEAAVVSDSVLFFRKLYANGLVFVILLVFLVMTNMLIAKFSLTVAEKSERAFDIWRLSKAKLMIQYERHWLTPPPVNVLEMLFMPLLWSFYYRRRRARAQGWTPSEQKFRNFSDRYRSFLRYQAFKFRGKRRHLRDKIYPDGTAVEKLSTKCANIAAKQASKLDNIESQVRLVGDRLRQGGRIDVGEAQRRRLD
ncbi:hypothetical protein BOX15_Mlig003738g1, partial [Macrostomum lignano]